ncbi:hypothetical protein [Larkinella soli]|uniref:hypothetical protein n=1 Tax=Larkinella soli TaxID=1770527 RepID=UPI000FFC0BF3|nr:hypothetical protein [Larkinella soli]
MKTLQNVLTINALSSGATGLLLVGFSDFIAQLFGIPASGIIIGVGIFLVAFAALVFVESRRNPMQPERVRFIILLDRLWVAVSLVLVVLPMVDLSVIGRVAVVAVAAWVALMAYLQNANLKKITT